MPPMSVTMDMSMAGDLGDLNPAVADVEGMASQNLAFAMSMRMAGDMADWTQFKIRLDMQMELGALKEQSGGRPILMGCTLAGDGETIWLEPDWSKAWFAEQLHEQGIGIENMVFSVQVSTVRQLLEVLPLVLPEEDRGIMQSVFDCSASPAALVQLTARTWKALSYEKRGGRVYVELESLPEMWAFPGLEQENPIAQFMKGEALRGLMEFDQATGAMLRAEYGFALAGGSMRMTYVTNLADRPFPAGHFRYQLPAGRKAFPVDVFMNPIVMELRRQAGAEADPANGDFEF